MSNLAYRLVPLAVLGFGLASTASAAPPTRALSAARNTTINGQVMGTITANSGVTAALRQVHTLLATADHDYNGHRAKAAQHVAQALRELGGHHAGTNHKAGTGPGRAAGQNAAGNRARLPQAQSDAQLQKALQMLSGLGGQIQNHPNAAGHVQSAITELNTALKIR
jgi:hypothetical protein